MDATIVPSPIVQRPTRATKCPPSIPPEFNLTFIIFDTFAITITLFVDVLKKDQQILFLHK